MLHLLGRELCLIVGLHIEGISTGSQAGLDCCGLSAAIDVVRGVLRRGRRSGCTEVFVFHERERRQVVMIVQVGKRPEGFCPLGSPRCFRLNVVDAVDAIVQLKSVGRDRVGRVGTGSGLNRAGGGEWDGMNGTGEGGMEIGNLARLGK